MKHCIKFLTPTAIIICMITHTSVFGSSLKENMPDERVDSIFDDEKKPSSLKASFGCLSLKQVTPSSEHAFPPTLELDEEIGDDALENTSPKKSSKPTLKIPRRSLTEMAESDDENWDDLLCEESSSTAVLKKDSLLLKKLKLQAHLQSLQLAAEPSRLSLASPSELKLEKSSKTATIKDDMDMHEIRTITWTRSSSTLASCSVKDDALGWDSDEDHSSHSTAKTPLAPQPTLKSPHQLRTEQLWSSNWYTRNSARVREAFLLLKQGKIKAANDYINDAANDDYPHALFHKAHALFEQDHTEPGQTLFTESIQALIKHELDMDDQSVEIFLHNAKVLVEKRPSIRIPDAVYELPATSLIRKKFIKTT